MKQHLLTLLLTAQVLSPNIKIKNNIIYECLPGRYKECGTGPIGFKVNRADGTIGYLIKNDQGKWVIVSRDTVLEVKAKPAK